MSPALLQRDCQSHFLSNGELIAGLHHTLDQCYAAWREAAYREWQRRFGGHDPSDACVSVRISGCGTRRLVA